MLCEEGIHVKFYKRSGHIRNLGGRSQRLAAFSFVFLAVL